jgi:hypothetical protein
MTHLAAALPDSVYRGGGGAADAAALEAAALEAGAAAARATVDAAAADLSARLRAPRPHRAGPPATARTASTCTAGATLLIYNIATHSRTDLPYDNHLFCFVVLSSVLRVVPPVPLVVRVPCA